MEQARYWMWTKRRHGFSSPHHLQASTNYDDSWEEQAFAEDAAGSLGGCIWPPRSYSCSFCGREFRSAQALGGHMNVHRRDRARLKQSPSDHHHPHDETLHHLHDHQQNIQTDHIQNTFLPVGFHEEQPDQVCDLVYSPNPNSDHSNTLPSSSSTSRVSPPPSKEYYPDKPLVPPFSSPIVREHSKKSPNSSLKSWSSFVADRYYHFSDLRSNEGDKRPRIVESGCRVIEDYALTESSSVTLNLVVRRTRPTTSGRKEESTVGCKRKRNDTSTLPFFLEPISMERHPRLQPADDEVPELISPSSVDDDIDLELRLGDRPKVK